jgi:CheY-like chemotaxis protein
VLESSGAIITTANSVPDAREKFKGASFDIVLTDLAMPGESGLALISHIRDQENGASGIPVIVLSACAFENDKQSALEAGASMFIPKPFRPTEIIRGVRQATVASAMRSNR